MVVSIARRRHSGHGATLGTLPFIRDSQALNYLIGIILKDDMRNVGKSKRRLFDTPPLLSQGQSGDSSGYADAHGAGEPK
jgi:hypothetical protein